MKRYLYRVVITEYPAGAQVDEQYGGHFDPEWKPDGWKADDEWRGRFGTDQFFWPSTAHEYKSRSGARTRAQLIETYGAKTIIQRSNAITWPGLLG